MLTIRAVLLALAVTITLPAIWWLLPAELELARKIPAWAATLSMLAMALALFLAIRPRIMEPICGGMDRCYRLHKWLGITGLSGALGHWILVPGPAGGDVIPLIANSGENMGELAMYLLLALGAMSMWRKIPYNIWQYTHRLMGPVFLLSVYHTFFSDVPFQLWSLTGFTLVLISLLGTGSWIYKELFYQRHIRNYRISRTEQLDNTICVYLKPEQQPLTHLAGQFAYLDFNLQGRSEFHPFTITSAPNDNELSFMIRNLGDYTERLQSQLKPGDLVKIDGPYGRFKPDNTPQRPQIWLAAGIGITPFIAWLRSGFNRRADREVHLFYTGKGTLFQQLLTKLYALTDDNSARLHCIDTGSGGKRLCADTVCQQLDQPLHNYQVYACGSKAMMKDLRQQLYAKGLKRRRWHNEHFNMR